MARQEAAHLYAALRRGGNVPAVVFNHRAYV